MNEQQLALIEHLLKSDEWTTASTLATATGVSIRSIKNYVSEMKRLYPSLIVSSSSGYKIHEPTAIGVLENLDPKTGTIPQSNKERVLYVILRLLRSPSPLNLYDLCDSLFISISTLRVVLKRVKRNLEQYQLELYTSGDLLDVRGTEQNRRQMLRSIIFSETNSNSFDLNYIQEIFDNIDTDYTENILKDLLWKNQYYVTEFSAYNIILHIIIAVDRNISMPATANSVVDVIDFPDFVPVEINEMSKELTALLEDYYEITFSFDDIREFALLIYTRANPITIHEMDPENLEDYIGHDCMLLINDIFKHLYNEYGIELSKPETKIGFALHIKNLMIRAKTQHFNRNPITESIKTSCPMIYDVAVNLSSIISDRINTSLIDDEIAYIAFHIGNAIEMQMAYESKISVILICPTYYNMKHDLSERLLERFGSDIIVENIIITESQLKICKEVDLILSTVPIKPSFKINALQIHPFLTINDTNTIEKNIIKIKSEKRQNYFFSQIRRTIHPEFCEHIDCVMSKEETLKYMCDRLIKAGYATAGFEKAIFEREQLSSTVFTNFAIPHAMNMRENKSCMYILINNQPILWDTNEVQLVIMLCFNASDRQVFYTVFEPLSNHLLKQSVIQQLIKTQSYEEVIDIISQVE